MTERPHHLALVGTTASGKSALALALARDDPRLEIVAVDSMQVYRGMDVGTAKPTAAERAEVAHHLLDLADPWEDYTLARYAAAARSALADIEARGQRALLVGGTGLYLRAVVDDLHVPGRFPEPGPRWRPSPTRRPSTTAWPTSTRGRPPAWSPPTAGAWSGPWR